MDLYLETTEIRKMQEGDIDQLIEIWFEASLIAHHFIPKAYWEAQKPALRTKYIPNSLTYIAVHDSSILGFISIVDDYLAALFVLPHFQGQGIGRSLLDWAKSLHTQLHLRVYSKNIHSTQFYQHNGFTTLSHSIDAETGEEEHLMEWRKEEKEDTVD